ncbi:MAG: universal stress protein [Taibaiella sp.]|nr:universal stress protein [Taibaiella sp.]
MSYIIAATDLSAVADNAVHYAAALAAAQRLDLVIMNAFSMPLMIGDVPAPASIINDAQVDAENKIRELEKVIATRHPGLAISSHVIYGNAIEIVEHYAQSHRRPLLAVLGNSIATESSAWFFSTLKTAANELSVPIIAVPPDTQYKTPGSACFALDIARENTVISLDMFAALCTRLQLTLHVLNVQKDVLNRDNVSVIPDQVKKALAPANPHYHFRYEEDIDLGIDRFCTEHNVDWLVVVHGKYSLFEGLFHRSHTKALAAITRIPMLILHEHHS